MNKRLYRSRENSQIAGVCGGLGNYFGIDSTWVRIFFVIMAFTEGFGLFLYLILTVIVPRVPEGQEEEISDSFPDININASRFIGVLLIIAGVVAVFWNFFPGAYRLVTDNFWGGVFILLGGAMLWTTLRRGDDNE
jgi:phage shock protein C